MEDFLEADFFDFLEPRGLREAFLEDFFDFLEPRGLREAFLEALREARDFRLALDLREARDFLEARGLREAFLEALREALDFRDLRLARDFLEALTFLADRLWLAFFPACHILLSLLTQVVWCILAGFSAWCC